MTILVTGRTGQLARALAAAGGEQIRCAGRPDFDFDQPETIASVFEVIRPSLVINAAAYTAVDAAESDPQAAYRANCDGPAQLADLCAAYALPFIHVSTDYVFDGRTGPYVETDPTNPQCVYGASKLAGERAAQAACPHAVVLRTSWVYAPEGKNFVLTMLNAARKTDRLRVVADQQGCPTAAADLADAVLAIAAQLQRHRSESGGIYHAAGSGSTSWYGFALAIFEEAARYGWPVPEVMPIATADWPTPARRPADSRLDCSKLAETFAVRLPPWRMSLARTIEQVCVRHGIG
ncbi:MAG: dTDP-4-dehydrorhamnose reductase [Acetobacteraceae bacterium]|nr:dTDP-4-dehydrorhamnose reductase [Acetobacteraceae bacterium]